MFNFFPDRPGSSDSLKAAIVLCMRHGMAAEAVELVRAAFAPHPTTASGSSQTTVTVDGDVTVTRIIHSNDDSDDDSASTLSDVQDFVSFVRDPRAVPVRVIQDAMLHIVLDQRVASVYALLRRLNGDLPEVMSTPPPYPKPAFSWRMPAAHFDYDDSSYREIAVDLLAFFRGPEQQVHTLCAGWST